MGLQFHPHAGTILICDFRGFVVPEMVKKRPVVVLTHRLPYRDKLCTIVPLSTTAPTLPQQYHFQLSRNYLPSFGGTDIWAKCDLVCSVSFARLDRVKVGKRKYATPKIVEADLLGIRQGVLAGLGLPHT